MAEVLDNVFGVDPKAAPTLASAGNVPQPPAEDAALAALRKQEQDRAERERIRSLQSQLGLETQQSNSDRFGLASLLGALTGRKARSSLLGSG